MAASLRYMGSKRSLAPVIAKVISRAHPRATIVDAFAGTCAVASAIAPQHVVVANDIHTFAATIARALFKAPGAAPARLDALTDLQLPFRQNLGALWDSVGKRIERERAALKSTVGRNWRQLFRFTKEELDAPVPLRLQGISSAASYRTRPTRTPYALFSMLYASSYFGVEQAAEIDSLRAAIERAPIERREFYLLALLESASHSAAAPGHFAQHLIPRDRANTQLIARFRRRRVWDRFLGSLDGLTLPKCHARDQNAVFNANAQTFVTRDLPKLKCRNGLVIYADPPYSRAQYSRYYHVLETLVLYDYPTLSGKGRYRDHRFNTNFSRAAQVLTAMNQFIAAAANTDAPLYLSYPTNGLVYAAGGDVAEMLAQCYRRVSVAISKTLSHSTLGGAPGAAALPVMERVFYATN